MAGPMPIGSPPAAARHAKMQRPAAAPGFAYLGLLVAVAALGMAAAGTVSLGARASRQDAERQLLAIGGEIERALQSYGAAATPAQAGIGPRALKDLLKDPRSAGLKRHLRRIRHDPLTGLPDWGLVLARDGSILGVYSLAEGQPQKQAGFGPAQAHFERAERYADWVFSASPERLPPRPGRVVQRPGEAASAAAGASAASAP